MTIRIVCSAVAVAALSGSAALLAQDATSRRTDMNDDTSYTGCLEAGAAKGTFRLSQAMQASMGAGKGKMGKDAMGKDAMRKDAMAKDTMAADAMSHDAMEMSTLSISSKQVDLARHVGHKVTVTGTDDMQGKEGHAFFVRSLKMVAGRCGS